MGKSTKFFKTYFILVIAGAIIGLLDSLLFTGAKATIDQVPIAWLAFSGIFAFGIFILSIIALYISIKNKLAKITLVIPIFYLAITVIVFVYGMVSGVTSAVQGSVPTEQLIPPALLTIGILSSSFELLFSVYVLSKFK